MYSHFVDNSASGSSNQKSVSNFILSVVNFFDLSGTLQIVSNPTWHRDHYILVSAYTF